jgi:hypothetical protein
LEGWKEKGMKEFRKLWSVPEYRRILTVMAIVFITLCIFFGTSGFSPGVQHVGVAYPNPICGVCQTFYFYAYPAGGTLKGIWLSEPTWPDDFPQQYCRWYDAQQAGR